MACFPSPRHAFDPPFSGSCDFCLCPRTPPGPNARLLFCVFSFFNAALLLIPLVLNFLPPFLLGPIFTCVHNFHFLPVPPIQYLHFSKLTFPFDSRRRGCKVRAIPFLMSFSPPQSRPNSPSPSLRFFCHPPPPPRSDFAARASTPTHESSWLFPLDPLSQESSCLGVLVFPIFSVSNPLFRRFLFCIDSCRFPEQGCHVLTQRARLPLPCPP